MYISHTLKIIILLIVNFHTLSAQCCEIECNIFDSVSLGQIKKHLVLSNLNNNEISIRGRFMGPTRILKLELDGKDLGTLSINNSVLALDHDTFYFKTQFGNNLILWLDGIKIPIEIQSGIGEIEIQRVGDILSLKYYKEPLFT